MRAQFFFPIAAPCSFDDERFFFAMLQVHVSSLTPPAIPTLDREAFPPACCARGKALFEWIVLSVLRLLRFPYGSSLPHTPATIIRVPEASSYRGRASYPTAPGILPLPRLSMPILQTVSRSRHRAAPKPAPYSTALAPFSPAASDRAVDSSRSGRDSSSCTPDPFPASESARSDSSFPASSHRPAPHCCHPLDTNTTTAAGQSCRKTFGRSARPFGKSQRPHPARAPAVVLPLA